VATESITEVFSDARIKVRPTPYARVASIGADDPFRTNVASSQADPIRRNTSHREFAHNKSTLDWRLARS